MPRILNDKSYYEAFELGGVDDGFNPVVSLLFSADRSYRRDYTGCTVNLRSTANSGLLKKPKTTIKMRGYEIQEMKKG
jgi:hypothetical protein